MTTKLEHDKKDIPAGSHSGRVLLSEDEEAIEAVYDLLEDYEGTITLAFIAKLINHCGAKVQPLQVAEVLKSQGRIVQGA